MNKKIKITDNLKKPLNKAFYGTAGYRSNTDDLTNIICRASFIAYLRSASFAGKRIGLMITASHNPVSYNGIKFIDHNGNILDKSWEKCSDDLVNCEDKDFHNMLNKILRKNSNICDINDGITGHVVIGRDTRKSGEALVEHIKSVLLQVDCIVEDYGEVSTPQMHFLIRHSNMANCLVDKKIYIQHLVSNFRTLKDLTQCDLPVFVDTANGIIEKNIVDEFNITIINDKNGIINNDCGADYVKTHSALPLLQYNFKNNNDSTLFASFDGDADRLILFTLQNGFLMLDGDAQAVLIANYFHRVLQKLEIDLQIGVILSFYTNSGCFSALKNFKTKMVQTGVKNFAKAAKKYDIGIYFEPNGHGSVMFSNVAIQAFTSDKTNEHKILEVLSKLFDPNIGDALANLLIFKCILSSTDKLKEYKENGSRNLVVKIQNKRSIITNDKNEVTTPKALQDKINEELTKFEGRAFIRPSGTEDVVRVFAECVNQRDADVLALKVAQLVYDMCDGVGNHPEIDYSKK